MNPIQKLIYLLTLTLLPLSSAYGVTFSWVGCGITKKAFMAELASAYQSKTGVEITLEGGGATKGIRSIVADHSKIGGSCRYRIAGDAAQESKVHFNPVAWDALVVVVHKDNPIQSISLKQLQSLYRGEINNWRQLGQDNRPLDLLTRRGKISGVGLTIRQLVFNDPEMEFPSRHVFKSSGPLEKAIEENRNAIAVTGISSARKRDLKILQLDGKSPDYTNIRSGDYTLYRPLYIVTHTDNPQRLEIKRFLGFAHSKAGRDIIRENGVVPYLEALGLTLKQREQWKQSRRIAQPF